MSKHEELGFHEMPYPDERVIRRMRVQVLEVRDGRLLVTEHGKDPVVIKVDDASRFKKGDEFAFDFAGVTFAGGPALRGEVVGMPSPPAAEPPPASIEAVPDSEDAGLAPLTSHEREEVAREFASNVKHESADTMPEDVPPFAVGVVAAADDDEHVSYIHIDQVRGYALPARVPLVQQIARKTLVLLKPELEDGNVTWRVERPLGPADDLNAALEALAYRTGLSPEFSQETLAEVGQIEQRFRQEGEETFIEQEARRSHFEYEGGPRAKEIRIVESFGDYDHGETRLDTRTMHGMKVCGIDPLPGNKKMDRDDLASFEDLGGGAYRIGIHIADPGHFVFPGSALDTEAYERQSTAYLPGHVMPLLPEVLGADICSLEEKKSRLAQSIFITVHPDGRREVWHGATIVRSDKNFSYDEADGALEDASHEFYGMLGGIKAFADQIREARRARGALAYDDEPEMKMSRDKDGNIRVTARTRGPTAFMIEDLAIAASEAVGQLLAEGEHSEDFVIFERVNVPPPLDRLMQIVGDMRKRDLRAARRPNGPMPDQETRKFLDAYERALALGEGTPERDMAFAELDEKRNAIVNHIQERVRGASARDAGFAQKMRGALRKISPPAYYSLKRGIGHSGLATIPYVHFTSPNRRRPDQIVKRLRDAKLTFAPVTFENEVLVAELEKEAERANAMMRRIDQAERDAHRLVALHALKDTEVGAQLAGLKITGYAPKGKGIFVSVPLPGGGSHRFTVGWDTLIGAGKNPKEEGATGRFLPGSTVDLVFKGIDFVNREALFGYEGPSAPPEPQPRKAAPQSAKKGTTTRRRRSQ